MILRALAHGSHRKHNLIMAYTRNLLSISAYVALALLAFSAVATGQPEGFTRVPLGGGLEGTILDYVVNRADDRAGGQDTVTMIYSAPQEGWIGVGFTEGSGQMVGADAVIGLPASGTVQKYFLGGYDSILPMDDEQQTLIDTSISQESGNTTMTFTKILNETGEIPIAIGNNTFIAAFGSTNDLFYHVRRDSFALDLVAGEVAVVETRKRQLWKAHGWFAALAWGLLSPLAIGAAVLRYWFPDGLWFKIHEYLNLSVIAFTVLAFALGVAAITSETPEGASAYHFSTVPYPHRFVGLIIFLFVVFQGVGGQFRPHTPDKGEDKSMVRRLWEVQHRSVGMFLLGLAWYQCHSGIKIYQTLFADSTANLSAAFWGVVGTISGLVVVGFVVTKITEKGDKGGDVSNDEEEVDS